MVLLMRCEQLVEIVHHWREIRMAFGGRVGTAAQAATQSLEIKNLMIGKFVGLKIAMLEE